MYSHADTPGSKYRKRLNYSGFIMSADVISSKPLDEESEGMDQGGLGEAQAGVAGRDDTLTMSMIVDEDDEAVNGEENNEEDEEDEEEDSDDDGINIIASTAKSLSTENKKKRRFERGGNVYIRPEIPIDNAGNDESEQDANKKSGNTELKALRFNHYRSAFDVDFDELDDYPWRQPYTDLSDFFNYGFNEETWAAYSEKQLRLRMEQGYGPKKYEAMGATAEDMVQPVITDIDLELSPPVPETEILTLSAPASNTAVVAPTSTSTATIIPTEAMMNVDRCQPVAL